MSARPLVYLGLVLLTLPGCVSTDPYGGRPYPASAKVGSEGGQDRYRICHHGRNTLTLPEPAIRAHLRHGDAFGSCEGNDRDGDRGRRRGR